MARGYPDFYGISIFPKYGSPTIDPAVLINCPNAATTQVFYVAGKGRIYGGSLRLVLAVGFPVACQLALLVDGVLHNTWSLSQLLEYNFTQFPDFLVHLTEYNREDDIYVLTFRDNVSFQISVEVQVINNTGGAVTATGDLITAIII